MVDCNLLEHIAQRILDALENEGDGNGIFLRIDMDDAKRAILTQLYKEKKWPK